MNPEQVTQHAWSLIIGAARAKYRKTGGDKTYEEIGEMCGVSKATAKRWIDDGEGGVSTPFPNMLRYLKAFGIPLEKALSIPGDIQAINGAKVEGGSAKGLQESGLTVLGVYAVAGAGPAWDAEDDEPMFNIAVPARYLRPHIIPLFINGTSMEPTILDNAVVGVNREHKDVVQGKIYAVRLPHEGIVIKRLYIDHKQKCFVLKSDNQKDAAEFPDVFLSFEDGDSFIYGRVSWVLQSYDR